MKSRDAELLARIDAGELPDGYEPAKHQEYVDRHWPKLNPEQVARALQLWKVKQEDDPDMPNRGFSFVKIMAYVAEGKTLLVEDDKQKTPSMDDPAKSHAVNAPESRASKPVSDWKWSAGTDAEGGSRKASPLEIPEGRTIHVVPFGLLEDDNPPVVLLPESHLAVTGRLATAHPVYFGITIQHPNGDFAGRFVTMRPADEFQSGKDFRVTLDFQDFQLDSSLVGMKDKLPSQAFSFRCRIHLVHDVGERGRAGNHRNHTARPDSRGITLGSVMTLCSHARQSVGSCRLATAATSNSRFDKALPMNPQMSINALRVVLLALLLMPCISLSAAKRPNVVMLLADDLGWKDIGCYGGPVKTPTLDRLAAGGVRFTDFYSGAAVCSPSRATLLTGRQHLRAGIYSWIHDSEQNSHLLQREVTLAEVLKSNGYETVHLGKWHLGMPTPQKPNKPTPADHGFDYWFATANNAHPSHKDPVNFIRNGTPVGKTDGYSCQVVVDEAISWLDEKRDPDKPFFLNVWFHEPHAPIAAPDEIVSRYGNLNDPAAIYSGTIDNTDRAIARLLEKLKQVDSPENTLIIYSSDNGSYRADRVGHLRGIKGSNYEGGIRVPGIFYWPGTIAGGRVEHEPAGLVDLLPTICGLLGIDKPQNVHLDGSDLSPLLTGRQDEFVRHQPLFWLLPASGPAVAIRDGRYSLVAHRDYEFPKDTGADGRLAKADRSRS